MQLHFYVPDALAAKVREAAEARGLTVSGYVAWLVRRELSGGWPDGYLESVVGRWEGDPLERGEQGRLESRDDL